MYNDLLGKKTKVVDLSKKLTAKYNFEYMWSLEFQQDMKTIFGFDKEDLDRLQNFLMEEFSGYIDHDESPINNAIYLLKKALEYNFEVKTETEKEVF